MADPISNPLQPFINLVQANMALLSKYAMSPEAMTQAMAQMQAAMTQGQAMDELNKMADHTYQTWERTGTDQDCRKAWCMNRVLQQLGPDMVAEPTHVQTASTRVQVLQDCGH